jgi:nucleotide-binding universal stress UspA family protein
MVHLDLDHTNDARLKIAGDLAQRFDASVIGIAACSQTLPIYYTDGFVADSFIDRDRIEIEKRLQAVRQRFEVTLAGRSKHIEWRSAMMQPSLFVAEQSRAADLIIIGAHRDRVALDPLRELIPGDLVISAGRPVLTLPQEVSALNAERILIAWKDSREARRAIVDALPLLKTCREAIVIEINDDPVAAQTHVDDIVTWLDHQGVKAESDVQLPLGKTAEQIDRFAHEVNADLIIAGAYGHSRFREWVLGGVTRDLITQATHCSLLSH